MQFKKEEITRLKAKLQMTDDAYVALKMDHDRLKAENEKEGNSAVQQFIDHHHNPIVRQKNDEIDSLTLALAEARECIKDIKCHDRECEGGQGCPEVIAEKFYNNPVGLRASEEMKGLRKVVEAAKINDHNHYQRLKEALEAYERGTV